MKKGALTVSVVIVLLLGGGSYLSARKLSHIRDGYPTREDPLYLPKGGYLKMLALDCDGLLSDLFWIKGSIYFGSRYRKKDHDYTWLYHLLNLSTDLDPQYYDVYWYGSSILPSVEESIRFLEKARVHFPDDWKLPEMIGFYYHYYLKDYSSAGRYYEIASRLPGHPPYVPSLAGRFYNQAGDIDAAIRVLKNFYDTSDREDLRRDFAHRIQQLHDIKLLEEKLRIFKERYGREPDTLSELVEGGIIPGLPEEPYGGSYVWDRTRKRVISTASPLYGDTEVR